MRARFIASRFEQNRAGVQGGAIFCDNGAMPWIEDCVFTGNTTLEDGNIVVLEGSRVELVRCSFSDNQARSGGVVYAFGGSVLMEDCLMSENHSTMAGGACYVKNSPMQCALISCTLEGNVAAMGGGINVEGSSLLVQSCTFAGNHATGSGAGLRVYQSTLQMENDIIAFSTQGQALHADAGSNCQLVCCDLYGNAGGDWTGVIANQLGVNGNITRDPIFCTTNPLRPYLLSAASPCAPEESGGCGLIGAWPVGCDSPQSVPPGPQPPVAGMALWLAPPRPSPFCATARVEFSIPEAFAGQRAQLAVLDAGGRCVRELLAGSATPGSQAVVWDGRAADGQAASGGLYFFRLECADQQMTTRGVLLR